MRTSGGALRDWAAATYENRWLRPMRVSGGDDANTQSRPQPASLRRVRNTIGPHQCAGEACVAPSQSGAIGELHSTLTAQRVVRAETVHEHGTPSPVSYVPGRQIVPARNRHWQVIRRRNLSSLTVTQSNIEPLSNIELLPNESAEWSTDE